MRMSKHYPIEYRGEVFGVDVEFEELYHIWLLIHDHEEGIVWHVRWHHLFPAMKVSAGGEFSRAIYLQDELGPEAYARLAFMRGRITPEDVVGAGPVGFYDPATRTLIRLAPTR